LANAQIQKDRKVFQGSTSVSSKAEQETLSQNVLNKIQNTNLWEIPSISQQVDAIKQLLIDVSRCSPKHQPALYAQILQKMNERTYQPEFLTLLNEQAKTNPQVAPIRNTLFQRVLENYRNQKVVLDEWEDLYHRHHTKIFRFTMPESKISTWVSETTASEVSKHVKLVKECLEVEKEAVKGLPSKQQKVIRQRMEHMLEHFQDQLKMAIDGFVEMNDPQVFSTALQGIALCLPNNRYEMLGFLYKGLQESANQAILYPRKTNYCCSKWT
jgi:hypothetical protein